MIPRGPGCLCSQQPQQYPDTASGTQLGYSWFAPFLPITSDSPLHAPGQEHLSMFKSLLPNFLSGTGTRGKKKKSLISPTF